MMPLNSSHPGYPLHETPLRFGACPITIAGVGGLTVAQAGSTIVCLMTLLVSGKSQ